MRAVQLMSAGNKGDCEADEPTANKGERRNAMRKLETAKLMSQRRIKETAKLMSVSEYRRNAMRKQEIAKLISAENKGDCEADERRE